MATSYFRFFKGSVEKKSFRIAYIRYAPGFPHHHSKTHIVLFISVTESF